MINWDFLQEHPYLILFTSIFIPSLEGGWRAEEVQTPPEQTQKFCGL